MGFQSFSFGVFLIATTLLCVTAEARRPRWGLRLLTVACLLFCLTDGLAGFLVLCAGLLVTAGATRYLAGTLPRRKMVLTIACGYHIAMLVLFKYTGFFTGGRAGMDWAPLGLSFFTFQQLWLLKEVYTREFVPKKGHSLLLYGFFFPTLTSGPILRPGTFFPQLLESRFLHPTGQDIAAGLYAICMGMGKKLALADPLGLFADNGWSMVETLSSPAAWLVMLAYTLELYLDFSGYCDIATGCARMLGLHLPTNFNSPYRALSVTDFWKRWHITLTTFLRECLYFPLGGSRQGTARTCRNIFIVFLVSGFWHGAGWTFLFWGALHGAAQVAERLLGQRYQHLPPALRWSITFLFLNLAWVFFRAPDLSSAGQLFSAAVSGNWALPLEALTAGILDSEATAITTLLPALANVFPALLTAALFLCGLTVVFWPRNVLENMETFRPTPGRCAALCLLLCWCVLSFSSKTTFIYSNF